MPYHLRTAVLFFFLQAALRLEALLVVYPVLGVFFPSPLPFPYFCGYRRKEDFPRSSLSLCSSGVERFGSTSRFFSFLKLGQGGREDVGLFFWLDRNARSLFWFFWKETIRPFFFSSSPQKKPQTSRSYLAAKLLF